MGNLERFSDAFQAAWCGIRRDRLEFERRMSNVERYSGSSGYEEDSKAAEKEYRERIEAQQADAREKLLPLLDAMRCKIKGGAYEAPSPEQVAMLQTLQMRGDALNNDDLERAASVLVGNDAAVAALAKIALDAGILQLPQPYTAGERARQRTFDMLRMAVDGLTHWDGRNADSVIGERMRERNVLSGGSGRVIKHALDAGNVARLGGGDTFDGYGDMEYRKSSFDLVRSLVGDDVSWDDGPRDLD